LIYILILVIKDLNEEFAFFLLDNLAEVNKIYFYIGFVLHLIMH